MIIKYVTLVLILLPLIALKAQDEKWQKQRDKIEQGVQKSPDNYKKWLSKGDFYLEFAQNSDNYLLEPQASLWAFEAYQKVLELKPNTESALQGIQLLHPVLINAGASAYENQDPQKALEFFLTAQKTNANDTLPYMYAGVVAYLVEDFQTYEKATKKLLEFTFQEKPDYFISLISFYLQKDDFDNANSVLTQALNEYPNHVNIKHLAIKYLIKTQQIAQAKASIEQEIASGNLPAEMYYNLALIYETEAHALEPSLQDTLNNGEAKLLKLQKDYDALLEEAITNYRKCLQISPDYHYATFNIGVIYFTQAVNIYRQLDKMTVKEFKSERSVAIQEESQVLFQKAAPYFEQLRSLSSLEKEERKMVLETLLIIYQHLENEEQLQSVKQELEQG